MRSEDTNLLAQITTALDGLRAQGTPLGVEIQTVNMTIHGDTVSYAYNVEHNDWDVSVQ